MFRFICAVRHRAARALALAVLTATVSLALGTFAPASLIETFDTYGTGALKDEAKPPWVEWQNGSGTTNPQIASAFDDSGNNVLRVSGTGSSTFACAFLDFNQSGQGLEPAAAIIAQDQFQLGFQFYVNSTSSSHFQFNLHKDNYTPSGNWQPGHSNVRVNLGGSTLAYVDTVPGSQYRSTDIATGLSADTWYSVALDVDQWNQEVDVYFAPGKLMVADLLADPDEYRKLQGGVFLQGSASPAFAQGDRLGWFSMIGRDGATGRHVHMDNLQLVPEPGSLLVLLSALACGLLVRRRKR